MGSAFAESDVSMSPQEVSGQMVNMTAVEAGTCRSRCGHERDVEASPQRFGVFELDQLKAKLATADEPPPLL
jgi:hypothetical protein